MYHKYIGREILIGNHVVLEMASDVSCEYSNELLPSIKGKKYRDQLNHYQLLKNNFFLWSYLHLS
jgi:hypothetical protein